MNHPVLSVFCLVIAVAFVPVYVGAHCDTVDGPVVAAAKTALEKGDVTPVLKWVKTTDEKEIRETFSKVVAARKASAEAREIADRYFFETLVRIHRAGEGAPYTGLATGPAEPIIVEADKALETGSVDTILKHMTTLTTKGIRERFNSTLEKKKHAEESVAAGRKFVESYVDFTHYLERLYNDAVPGKVEGSPAGGGHGH